MRRRWTREVRVGHVTIGGASEIAIQSMTTTTPLDLEGSLAQIAALEAAGCQLVRLAVPSVEAAAAFSDLRRAIDERGHAVALIADVHFNPRAAYEAALHVEKVRINPGNFAADLDEARARLRPLLARLRDRGAALRIGVNHGSLAAHIADDYGHGPRGMVASAMEYLQLCRAEGFEDIIVALKASNPTVMVAANRLLVERMRDEGMDYPIHLGVTEAGLGMAGGLRSAAGIGALLLEGIGDTIRVSLTGDPVAEITPCRRILRATREARARWAGVPAESLRRRDGWAWLATHEMPRVEQRMSLTEGWVDRAVAAVADTQHPAHSLVLQCNPDGFLGDAGTWTAHLDALGERIAGVPVWIETRLPDRWWRGDADAEVVHTFGSALAQALRDLGEPAAGISAVGISIVVPAEVSASAALALECSAPPGRLHASEVLITLLEDVTGAGEIQLRWHLESPATVEGHEGKATWLNGVGLTACWLHALSGRAGLEPAGFSCDGGDAALAARMVATHLGRAIQTDPRPLLITRLPEDPWNAAVQVGALLLDGLVDMIQVAPQDSNTRGPESREFAYALLHATRRRLDTLEFISCPGCGRLAYDHESTVKRLQALLGHLHGIKIAVMGCAVNGPGEMADADFGYVGSVAEKVDVYAGKERVRRGLTAEEADRTLVELIRQRGMWRDPPR